MAATARGDPSDRRCRRNAGQPADEAGEIAYVERTMSGFSEGVTSPKAVRPLPGCSPPASAPSVPTTATCLTGTTGADPVGRHRHADLRPADGVVVDTGLLDARGHHHHRPRLVCTPATASPPFSSAR